MEHIGYIAAIFIGISLGLIGGGGSILTVPVLVYLFKIDTILATSYSLFVVGLTSFVGSISYFRKKLVDLKTAFIFGIPSMMSVYLTRTHLLSNIPETIYFTNKIFISKSVMLMALFAILMVMASYKMIKKDTSTSESKETPFEFPLVVTQGIFTGVITGLIGAGGGFLIIPVLVNLLKIPMKLAVGTSLFIISINSLIGFIFSIQQFEIDYPLLITISSFAISGIFIGTFISKKLNNEHLKPIFGVFILVLGMYILARELIF